MTNACPRSFEVEALHNGRLSGTERASFERHLANCGLCSREARALAALGDALRDGVPAPADELHVRRERTRLLAEFDRGFLAERGAWFRRGVAGALVLVAAAALAVTLFVVVRSRPVPPPSARTNTVVNATNDAVWSRRLGERWEAIVLERGELEIEVRREKGWKALRVELPDGELEDEGTIFTVSVYAGRTTRVTVREGSVSLRLRGQPPTHIAAGESWNAAPHPLPPSASSRIESSTSSERVERPRDAALSAPGRPAPAPTPASSAPPASSVPNASPVVPSASAQTAAASAASDDFRAAVASYNRGSHAEAAVLLARFLARYPGDARGEDASYLRVLAFRKIGDEASRRRAAADYLRRYPSGFRRSEVEALLR
ncbi:MAG TPA: FecR domain-containing protein [Polyangiaceae bacterium]